MSLNSTSIPKTPMAFGIFGTVPHKWWALGAVFFVCCGTFADRFSVILLRNLTDSLSQQSVNIQNVWIWGIAYACMFLLGPILWRGSGFTGMRWFVRFRTTGYKNLFRYTTFHSKDYFNNRFAGALANKISNAVEGVEDIYATILWQFLPLVLSLIIFIFITLESNHLLGIIMGIWSVFFITVNIWLGMKLQPYSFIKAEANSTMKGIIIDSISNISLVHEYAHIDEEQEYVGKYITKYQHTHLSQWMFSEWIRVLNGLLVFIFVLMMISTSLYLFQQHIISIGVIVMVIAVVSSLGDQLFSLGQKIKDTAQLYGQAQEGLTEILSDHLIVNKQDASHMEFKNGEIEFEKIHFDYGGAPVFKDFSLHVPSGQKIGLVGRSGAGKSTFVSLLLRHYNLKEGDIKIDNSSIYDITLSSLRRGIAFVPQDTSMFHRSIRENISYGNPKATDEEVRHAAKLAFADGFIEALPNGYDTLVGERGIKLSGGQRQRIAIARAFLKNAPILVLDEATSSLDSESEHAIQESLGKLMQGRTVIAISHRLSTLKKMDRIIVIGNGKILEDGDPNDLIKKDGGIFKKLWDHQVKGFIRDEDIA